MPLLHLWAFVACYRMNFTFVLSSQAVPCLRRLVAGHLTWMLGFCARSVRLILVVHSVALGEVAVRIFRCVLAISFHQCFTLPLSSRCSYQNARSTESLKFPKICPFSKIRYHWIGNNFNFLCFICHISSCTFSWLRLTVPGCWQVLSPTRKETSSEACQGRARFQQHRDASCHQVSFLQGKAPKEIHTILSETLACFPPGRAKDLLALRYILSVS